MMDYEGASFEDLIQVIHSTALSCFYAADVEEMFNLLYPNHELTLEHFTDTIKSICNDECCDGSDLASVLLELKRRVRVRDDSFWEFQLLDTKRKGGISIPNAKLLFESVHGEDFLRFWDRFCRTYDTKLTEESAIKFRDIEMHLCSIV